MKKSWHKLGAPPIPLLRILSPARIRGFARSSIRARFKAGSALAGPNFCLMVAKQLQQRSSINPNKASVLLQTAPSDDQYAAKKGKTKCQKKTLFALGKTPSIDPA
jgi:hypothetical protein